MIVEARKACTGCGENKPLSCFYRNAAGRLGLHSLCKPCVNALSRAKIESYRQRGEARIPARKFCGMCKHTLPESGFCRSQSTIDGLRTYCKQCDKIVRRANKYGLSRDRVVEMLTQTNCEACGIPLPTSSQKHIDHRHADGAVRGVLCEACNTTLGKCRESREVLLGLCAYLGRTADVDYRFQPYVEQDLPDPDICPSGAPTPEEPGTKCQTTLPQKSISRHP